MKHGLGYCGRKRLDEAFPNTSTSKEKVNGVTIVTRTAKDGTQNKLYFSKEIGIFIKGELEIRRNESYCRITGTNLSKL